MHTCTHTHHLLYPALLTKSDVIRRWMDIRMVGPPATGWHPHLWRWSRVNVGVTHSSVSDTCMRVHTIERDETLHQRPQIGVWCLLIWKIE